MKMVKNVQVKGYVSDSTGYAYCEKHAPNDSSPADPIDLAGECCVICELPLTNDSEEN